MNYLDLLCPDCLNKLEYHNSTFSQYQPSYWCKKCNEEKEFNYVRGFNLGYTRQERSGLRVEIPSKKKEERYMSEFEQGVVMGFNDCIDEMKKINSSSAIRTVPNEGLNRKKLDRIANEAIGDKIGYYKDEEGVVDIVITAILSALENKH